MTGVGVQLFCIDGTNLVRGSFGYEGPQFRAQEEADAQRMVMAFGQVCAGIGGRIEIEVYFDGQPRAGLASREAGLSVRFTRELKADDVILDRVSARRYSGEGKVTVVTSDAELGARAKEEGGRWLRVARGAKLETVVAAIEGRFSR